MPFKIQKSEEITSRDEFSLLCDWRKLVRAVEVGTEHGHFARQFLSRWRGELLICVDDFETHDDQPSDRLVDMLQTTAALSPFGARGRVVKARSVEAATNLFPWFGPEFIYIDAAHDYESVRADIAAWWARLSPIGILAGHDFQHLCPGVIQAVSEFARDRSLIVRVTDDYPASWYIYKNEPTAAWTRLQRENWDVLPAGDV